MSEHPSGTNGEHLAKHDQLVPNVFPVQGVSRPNPFNDTV